MKHKNLNNNTLPEHRETKRHVRPRAPMMARMSVVRGYERTAAPFPILPCPGARGRAAKMVQRCG